MKHIVSRMSSYFPNRWPLSLLVTMVVSHYDDFYMSLVVSHYDDFYMSLCMRKPTIWVPTRSTKALISFTVTKKLMCVFVFAYADCWFSHGVAHNYHLNSQKNKSADQP